MMNVPCCTNERLSQLMPEVAGELRNSRVEVATCDSGTSLP